MHNLRPQIIDALLKNILSDSRIFGIEFEHLIAGFYGVGILLALEAAVGELVTDAELKLAPIAPGEGVALGRLPVALLLLGHVAW